VRVGQEQNRRYFAVCGLSLFFLLVGFYLLTFQGFPLSIDELFIYDMTESFVRRGDFYRTYEFSNSTVSAFQHPLGKPQPGAAYVDHGLAVLLTGTKPAADSTMHVVWLSNVFITALTAVSLYVGAAAGL
jgi:hypothetical protein